MKWHLNFLLSGLLTTAPLMSGQVVASEPDTTLTSATLSKRIEVYSISQNFWDVSAGDTLSGIVKQLLPNNSIMGEKLSHEIISLNPHAFSNNQADSLKANVRLWLPNSIMAAKNSPDRNKYNIKSFSWGQINTPKRN